MQDWASHGEAPCGDIQRSLKFFLTTFAAAKMSSPLSAVPRPAQCGQRTRPSGAPAEAIDTIVEQVFLDDLTAVDRMPGKVSDQGGKPRLTVVNPPAPCGVVETVLVHPADNRFIVLTSLWFYFSPPYRCRALVGLLENLRILLQVRTGDFGCTRTR